MRKRIIFFDSGVGRGGAKHSLLTWIQMVRRSPDLDFTILVGGDGWLLDQLRSEGIPFQSLPMPRQLGMIRHGMWKTNPLRVGGYVASMALALVRAWWQAGFVRGDALILTGGRDFVTLLPLALRLKHYTTTVPQTTDWGRIPTCRTMCRTVAETWAISETVAASIRAMGIPAGKIRVLPLIFTEDRMADAGGAGVAVRAELGLPESVPVVGMTGVIREQKGQREAVRVFARVRQAVPEARLVLVGGSQADSAESVAYEQDLRALVAAEGLAEVVVFAGWRADAARVMRAFDILLVPSLDNEGVPRVILEGLEAGRPIVATAMPQFQEILGRHGVGELVRIDDVDGWANAVVGLLSDDTARARAGARARAAWETHYSRASAEPVLLAALRNLARSGEA